MPLFVDGDSVTVMVAENTPSTGYVGGPVMASSTSALTYELGGTHIGRFELAPAMDAAYYHDAMPEVGEDPVDDDRNTGPAQIIVKPVTHLDFEAGINYSVEVTATDSEGQRATAMVTIVVEDVNEAPSEPRGFSASAMPPVSNTAPTYAATSTTRMVAENTAAGTAIGDPVAAMDADRGDTLSYELGGADAASFAIDSETGQLMTSAALDYETMMEYMVTVTATDSDGETDMIYVTIMVTNVGLDNAYDMDDSGDISRAEVIAAIRDYLFNDALDRDGVIEVIRLYIGIGS